MRWFIAAFIVLPACSRLLCGADVVGGGTLRIDASNPATDPPVTWSATGTGATLDELAVIADLGAAYDTAGTVVSSPTYVELARSAGGRDRLAFRARERGSLWPHDGYVETEIDGELIGTQTAAGPTDWRGTATVALYAQDQWPFIEDSVRMRPASGTLTVASRVAGQAAWHMAPRIGSPAENVGIDVVVVWAMDPAVHIDGTKLCR